MKVWLLSIGSAFEGWRPLGVFSSEEKALKRAAEHAKYRIDTKMIFHDLKSELHENITDEEIVDRHNEVGTHRTLLWEATELDKNMVEDKDL